MASKHDGVPPVPGWVEHDSWLAVKREFEQQDRSEEWHEFERAFGYTGSDRKDREVLTEVLPVPESETPYRPPITTDEHLADDLEALAREIARYLEQEIKRRLSLDE